MKALFLTLPLVLCGLARADVGLGFASFGSGGSVSLGGGTFSVLANVDKLSIQGFAGIPTARPFLFGVGGVTRFTLIGTKDHGIHAGAGLNVGLTPNAGSGSFFFNFFPVAGFHFRLNEQLKDIILHFDGAFVLAATPTTDIAFGPIGGIIASIHYML